MEKLEREGSGCSKEGLKLRTSADTIWLLGDLQGSGEIRPRTPYRGCRSVYNVTFASADASGTLLRKTNI